MKLEVGKRYKFRVIDHIGLLILSEQINSKRVFLNYHEWYMDYNRIMNVSNHIDFLSLVTENETINMGNYPDFVTGTIEDILDGGGYYDIILNKDTLKFE